jgi:nicotinamide riboside kinase
MNYQGKPPHIYVVGAQSTGKTTVVKALEEHFRSEVSSYEGISQPKIITEVARTVLQQHSFSADDITSSPTRALALQKLILQAQLSAERDISEHEEWFISDRSGVDPMVYARKYVSEEAESDLIKSAEWKELSERMRKSVVIVCEAGTEWLTDDGVRLMPESREEWIEFHELFCSRLDALGLEYEILPSNMMSLRERVAFVLRKWKTAYQS